MEPLIHLRPLTESEWEPLQRECIAHYAEEQVQVGRWSTEEALGQASKEYEGLLPDGIHTDRHHIREIIERASGEMVGFIWYQEREKAGKRCVFLCDLFIFRVHRRRGFGAAVMAILEDLARDEHGAERIELHVFGHNRPARSLYVSAGFREMNVLMAKDLV